MVDPRSQRTIPQSPAEPIGHQKFALHPATSARVRDIHRASVIRMALIYNASTKRHPREGTAALPYAENLASATQAIFVTTTHHIRAGTEACPYESLYRVRFPIGKRQSTVINKPVGAQRGGMLSGSAASRTGQLLDTASQHTFGGWQGGHHPRWQFPPPQSEMITPTIRDGRPT